MKNLHQNTLIMGSQLRWLERTPDKREVDGSIPFEPTKLDLSSYNRKYIENCIDDERGNQDIRNNILVKTIEPKRKKPLVEEKSETKKRIDSCKSRAKVLK